MRISLTLVVHLQLLHWKRLPLASAVPPEEKSRFDPLFLLDPVPVKDEPPTTYEDIRAELQDPAADTQDALADQVASETAHADANTVAEADCPEIDYPDTEFPETSEYYKAHHSRTTFGNWDVEKVHAVVAQSTFRSQNVQSTPCSDHFWKLRCRKSVRGCGAKHVSKSKVQKTDGYAALLDVQMCFRVAGARDCAPSQK